MRHYEIVFLVHPDQSEQVPAMMERYRRMIESAEGQIHREEDWGRRQLSHAINKIHKAHYLMFNIECSKHALDELVGAFDRKSSITPGTVSEDDCRESPIVYQFAEANLLADLGVRDEGDTGLRQLFVDQVVFFFSERFVPTRQTVFDLSIGSPVLFEHEDRDPSVGQPTCDFSARRRASDHPFRPTDL